MSFTQEQINTIVYEEVTRWKQIHSDIVQETRRTNNDMLSDRKLARQLTAELVSSKRVEDKVQLASDEAVAHGLSKLRRNITESYDQLAKQPYFARVVTSEEDKEVEFFLGTASFAKHRIIDWRKAPISQLYYKYKQGDEFDEEIQGKDRLGIIKLRRGYKGIEDELHAIELPEGIIQKKGNEWHFEERANLVSRSSGHDGHLPSILSLITEEQFDLISHAANKPIIIQGIAGSGKTTVALHRLAWLLHKDNSDARPAKCMVVVFNRALKNYIETTLPELGIQGVNIVTYNHWLGKLAHEFGGGFPYDPFKSFRELETFKSSAIVLEETNNYVSEYSNTSNSNYTDDLFRFYEYLSQKELFWPNWKSIRHSLHKQAKKRSRTLQDDSILLNLVFAREGYYPCKRPGLMGLCDHIVIDEAQDYGVVEIRALLNALDIDRTVTIVGDLAQKIIMNRHFGSWQELLQDAGFADTTPIELTVSHRSTEEVMTLALKIRTDIEYNQQAITTRHGPEPHIIRTSDYQTQPYEIGKWIDEQLQEDPNSLSAIICRLPKQAERLTETLKKIGYPFVRWGHRDNFEFTPGVTITNVNQVKGLEFKNVLIVNPTEDQYNSQNDEERNLLYVAVTRAERKLDVISYKNPTTMLRPVYSDHCN